MIPVTMTDITRDGLHIPGGWTAKIPSIRLYPEEQQLYVGYYCRKGMSEAKATSHVIKSFLAIWVRGWTMTLREAVVNLAKRYRQMHPELGLAGFDPEAACAAYVPGENTGQRGKPAAIELLRQMGEAEMERRKGEGER